MSPRFCGNAFALATAYLLTCMPLAAAAELPASDIPHLEKRDGITKLIVDGNPFICVAGELFNSTSSDIELTKATMPRLAKANLNTVLSVVSWDLIEPEEGKFDFSMVDYQIQLARENNIRLVLLWMGSWKNGLSHYVPGWVKADQQRFPRVVNASGNPLEILSTLSQGSRDADARAFAAVMKHIREVDATHRVIAMQVENEVGTLGTPRDFSSGGNEAFAQQVPPGLIDYLQKNKDMLRPELKKIWDDAGDKTSGTWQEVFGKNVPNPEPPMSNPRNRPMRPEGQELFNHTDEIFMAWNYSSYIGYVAAAGKKEYPLPMYINAWLVQPMDRGPGDYPTGGAEPLVHDIWHAGGPAIDILAPDIYQPAFADIIKDYARNGNPAWNPETRQDANNCWNAFTTLNLLCYSPFGIDRLSPDSSFARAFGFINSISGALAEAQGKREAIKLMPLEAGKNPGKVEVGNYIFDFTPVAGGRNGAGRPARDAATLPAAAEPAGGGGLGFLNSPFVLIINTSPDEFYLATNGNFPFIVSPKPPSDNIAAAATIDRGYFRDGQWVLAHRYNGDDIMSRGYDISAAAANHQAGTQIPFSTGGRGAAVAANADGSPGTVVFRVTLYQYH